MEIIQSPSPNFSNSSYKIIGAQIHKTLGTMPSTLDWLRDVRSQASAHYLITRKGVVHQLVALDKRPWSSGRIANPSARAKKIMKRYPWGSYVQPGHYLAQIEFECLFHQTFTEEQYEAFLGLIEEVLDFTLTPEKLLEHQDTAIDKPDLDTERAEILRRIQLDQVGIDFKGMLAIEDGSSVSITNEDGRIIIKEI